MAKVYKKRYVYDMWATQKARSWHGTAAAGGVVYSTG